MRGRWCKVTCLEASTSFLHLKLEIKGGVKNDWKEGRGGDQALILVPFDFPLQEIEEMKGPSIDEEEWNVSFDSGPQTYFSHLYLFDPLIVSGLVKRVRAFSNESQRLISRDKSIMGSSVSEQYPQSEQRTRDLTIPPKMRFGKEVILSFKSALEVVAVMRGQPIHG